MYLTELKREILKDPILSKLSNQAKEKNISLFLVGGYIRDLFLGIPRKDYDLTLPKEDSPYIPTIEEILQLRFFSIGKEEMNTITYRIVKKGISIDLTMLQGKTIEEDLQRRDFTINAAAFSLQNETFHSVNKTWEDIRDKVIRAVSSHSIDQDPLRMLRAVRYLCTLDGFTLDRELEKEIILKKDELRKQPGERIKMELDQMLLSPRPEVGMRYLYELGLLFILMPELKNLENLGQNEHHHLNVLAHTLLMIKKVSDAHEWIIRNLGNLSFSQDDWLSLYYTALFHDIGKQDTYVKDEKERVHFYHHENFSGQRAEVIMDRLRFSTSMKKKILLLIQNHMRILNLSHETKETALKRLVNQMADGTPLLVILTLADKEASRGILSIQIDDLVEDHSLRILELFKEKGIVHPPPLISGHDVMALGYPSGPKVGQILNFIHEKQVDGEIKTRNDALEILKLKFGRDRKS
jgi:poly(A) polymerase